jgi:hypothetical protein
LAALSRPMLPDEAEEPYEERRRRIAA